MNSCGTVSLLSLQLITISKLVSTASICFESTGVYEEVLGQYLYDNNFKVSVVVNPARVKGFAQSKLWRIKTDKADSELIAQVCQL